MKIDGIPSKVEIPKREFVAELLRMFHDQVGHPGMNSTSSSLQNYYTWKGMNAEIVEYVSDL